MASESERREFYLAFAKGQWAPADVARWPIPQIVRVWMHKECERTGGEITREQAIELLRQREALNQRKERQ